MYTHTVHSTLLIMQGIVTFSKFIKLSLVLKKQYQCKSSLCCLKFHITVQEPNKIERTTQELTQIVIIATYVNNLPNTNTH